MTIADILYSAWGVFLGLLLGFGNSFLREYFAIKLLKTDKKTAVTFISILSVVRLGIILLAIFLMTKYISKAMALGTLGGLVLHTIFTTAKYRRAKKINRS